MCRLFASISKADPDLQYRKRALEAFFALSNEHKDGWGIGRWADRRTEVVKEPVAAHESPRVKEESTKSVGPVLIAHIRWASIGRNSLANTHPFNYGKWIYGHNGTLDFKGKLVSRMKPEYLQRIQGDTDSEVLFHWLLQNMDEHGEEQGMSSALGEAYRLRGTGTTALNFVLSDGDRLFALNAPFTRFDHYGMSYLLRESENELIVCSQPLLGAEGWKRFPRDSLLVVGRNLELRFHKIT
jgi:predicted glutamine amidotransferase